MFSVDTYSDWTVLLLRQVDIHHFIHVLVQIFLAAEALVQLLELVIGQTTCSVVAWCVVHLLVWVWKV